VLTMSKVTSGIVLFSLLMALSLGVAFGEDEAAEETVVEINKPMSPTPPTSAMSPI